MNLKRSIVDFSLSDVDVAAVVALDVFPIDYAPSHQYQMPQWISLRFAGHNAENGHCRNWHPSQFCFDGQCRRAFNIKCVVLMMACAKDILGVMMISYGYFFSILWNSPVHKASVINNNRLQIFLPLFVPVFLFDFIEWKFSGETKLYFCVLVRSRKSASNLSCSAIRLKPVSFSMNVSKPFTDFAIKFRRIPESPKEQWGACEYMFENLMKS